MSSTRPVPRLALAVAVLVLGLLAPVVPATAEVSDTIQVVKDGEDLSNLEIVARLAEATFTGTTSRVLIGREDNFADNMSSAVMQGDSPLLLVPSGGPVPQRVLDLLELYNPAEVVLLGGEAAVSEAVADELGEDYTVSRRSGPTRFETAIDIASREAPTATTAILSRGFGDPASADETQAFADALAAGGWAADEGWPVLFTTTAALPNSVREYLDASAIEEMMIMGGTAAVSQAVEEEIEALGITTTRVAGATRFDTALAVAAMRGADNASDADRVVLVEGQAEDAWAGGFAAAAHSAAFDAPIVLSNGDSLPASTTAFLSGGARSSFAQDGFFDSAVLTCAAVPEACDQARTALGLPDEVPQTFDPASGSTIEAGSQVSVTVGDTEETDHEISGDCITTVTGTAPGTGVATILSGFSGECTITSTLTLPSGATQRDTATYTVQPADGGILTWDDDLDSYAWVPGPEEELVEVGEDDTFLVDGQAASQAIFFQSATPGDVVAQSASFAQGTQAVEHSLTNVDELDIRSGMLGDVTTGGAAAAIIEPVSGTALRSLTFPTDALYTVDGVNVPRTAFLADANEGDQVALDDPGLRGTPTYALTNDEVSGPVTASDVFSGSIDFKIDSGGYTEAPVLSPLLGDDPNDDSDLLFHIDTLASSGYALTIDGEAATGADFEDELSDEDLITYSREDGVESFDLVNMDQAASAGRLTEDYDSALDTFTLLESTGRVTYSLDPDAVFVIDGVLSSQQNAEDAASAGDGFTVTPATATDPQRIEIVNDTLDGMVDDVTVATFTTFDVLTADGLLYDNAQVQGDVFSTGNTTNRYYVDDVEVTQGDFITALQAAEPEVDPIEVISADDLGGIANEFRLGT